MASSLPLTIKKEDDILPRPCIPKRKAAILNIPPRARFAKARPNISGLASKASKETQPFETEKNNIVVKEDKIAETKGKLQTSNTDSTSVNANVQASESESIIPENQTLKKEPEILQRPSVLPKRTLPSLAAPRARYQKARPNIAALANKASKGGSAQGEGGRISANEKESITDLPKLKASKSQDNLVKESVMPYIYEKKPIKNIEPVKGFSFSKGEVDIFPEAPSEEESIVLPNDVQHEKRTEDLPACEIQGSSVTESLSLPNETANIVPSSGDVVLNSDEEDEYFEIAAKQQKKSDNLKDLSKIMSKNACETVNEGPPPTPIVSKAMEYPTLKSILNSPRKRATSKKTYERKRRLANLSETPSRSEMTMTDLIYFNPTGEPMKVSKPQTCAVENLPADENTKPAEPEPEEDESSNAPVPKVIINENGEIIIDESSLVVRRKETIDTSIEAIIENDNTTYSSFRKKSSRQWSTKETSKFYKALSLVGTDFALMENIFCVKGKVTRSRRELKLKFKREEKVRLELVHKAMYETQTYDISILDDDPEELTAEDVDAPEIPVPKKRGRKPKADNENKPNAQKKKKNAAVANESSIDENDEVCDVLNDNLYPTHSEEHADSPESDPNKDQTPRSKEISRPQRVRKTKILSDYVTDVDSENSDDDISDNNCETVSKKLSDCPETIENTDNVQSSVEKPVKARKRKKLQVLSVDSFDSLDTQKTTNPAEIECAVTDISRLGRVRRAKVLTDFITDEVELDGTDGSDDESVKGVGKRRKVQALLEDSSEECFNEEEIGDNCIMIEHVNCLPDSGTVEVIEKEKSPELVVQKEGTESNQEVVFLAAISSPRGQDSRDPANNDMTAQSVGNTSTNFLSEMHVDDNAQHSNHKQSPAQGNLDCDENVSSHESLVLSLKPPTVGNPTLVEGKRSNNCNNQTRCVNQKHPNSESMANLLTNGVVSEVVITDSTKTKRVRKRAIAPNLARSKQRPRMEVEMPHVQPSFSHFTPAEEHYNSPKEIKTYSRNIKKESSPVQAGLQLQVDHTMSTDSTANIQMIHGPGTSFQNNQTILLPFNSVDSHQKNLDSGNTSQNNQTVSNSQTITLDSGANDPPPMMIFTKSPNNENILHLFMVSPKHSF